MNVTRTLALPTVCIYVAAVADARQAHGRPVLAVAERLSKKRKEMIKYE
jgi:hypothetical protein